MRRESSISIRLTTEFTLPLFITGKVIVTLLMVKGSVIVLPKEIGAVYQDILLPPRSTNTFNFIYNGSN